MKVVIIGTGNVATFLWKQWSNSSDIKIEAIVARSKASSKNFPAPESLFLYDYHSLINKNFDAIILAIKDDALISVANTLRSLNIDAVLLHCSGALKDAENLFDGYIWPVYSINKTQDYTGVSVPVAYHSFELLNQLLIATLATATGRAFDINPLQKPYLHLAATMSNNFIHHLLVHTAQVTDEHAIDRRLLLPILLQTIQNFTQPQLDTLQTGAAVREDTGTMQHHIDLLQQHEQARALYVQLSQSIIALKKGK